MDAIATSSYPLAGTSGRSGLKHGRGDQLVGCSDRLRAGGPCSQTLQCTMWGSGRTMLPGNYRGRRVSNRERTGGSFFSCDWR
jgi:hypothetical protein